MNLNPSQQHKNPAKTSHHHINPLNPIRVSRYISIKPEKENTINQKPRERERISRNQKLIGSE